MEISMKRGTHLHLQGLELSTMEEEKKNKAMDSLSLSLADGTTIKGGGGLLSLL